MDGDEALCDGLGNFLTALRGEFVGNSHGEGVLLRCEKASDSALPKKCA